jgi:two-component system sensor histidine kinase CreC
MGVLVILMGMMFSFWITSPIEKLTVYAQAIRDGKRPPMPRLGRSEIGKLGSAFEEMRDSLEGKQYVENYVQTLTHEMKSPLSAIRGAAELMEEQMSPEQHERFLNNIRTEADRIQNLIDRLLLLSALESRKGLQNPIRVDLSELAASIAESMQPQLKTKRIQLETRIQENVTRMGERFFLRQAMINLLQNAIDFTPPGGRITVTLETRDNAVSFTVKDTGPGIPEFALTKVFDRFYSLPRPDSGLKSSGLGLTFVREVALLHGGEAHLENSSGGGARATLIVS